MNTVRKRVYSCRLITKMQKDPDFSKKLGLVNQISFLESEVEKKERIVTELLKRSS